MSLTGVSRRDCLEISVLAPFTALESEIGPKGVSEERTGEIGSVLRRISGIDCRLGGSFQEVPGRAWNNRRVETADGPNRRWSHAWPAVPGLRVRAGVESKGSTGVLRLICSGGGGKFLASHQAPHNGQHAAREVAPLGLSTVGPVMLRWRAMVLRILEHVYWSVTAAGSLLILTLGGFVPVLRGWLYNEVDGWADAVRVLGGVWFRVDTRDSDADLGPVLARLTPRSCSPRSIWSRDGLA